MNWSIGEISSLAIKAVRGFGQPWGVAEEAGWAIGWLGRSGLPGADALAAALETGELLDLMVGISLADRGVVPTEIATAAAPLLVVPFLGRVASEGKALQVHGGSAAFRVWQHGCDPVNLPAGVRLQVKGTVPMGDKESCSRLDPSSKSLTVLQNWAHRTYAPATEASRLAGAGAGVTDND